MLVFLKRLTVTTGVDRINARLPSSDGCRKSAFSAKRSTARAFCLQRFAYLAAGWTQTVRGVL